MKKLLLVIFISIFMASCGTIMEKQRKDITINSSTPVRAYADGTKYIGEGTSIVYSANNRSAGSDKFIVLREIGNENNIQTVEIEREFNNWSLWNFAFYFGVPYVIDFATGGYKRIGQTSYSIPPFSYSSYNSSNDDNSYSSHSDYTSKKNNRDQEIKELKAELERMKLKNEIKNELEVERTKERIQVLESQKK